MQQTKKPPPLKIDGKKEAKQNDEAWTCGTHKSCGGQNTGKNAVQISAK